MSKVISVEDLKQLFTKTYGMDAPSKQKWAEFYNENVTFIDPTQETKGLSSYIKAQEKLVKRCDDVYLETHSILVDANCGFVEWTMAVSYTHLTLPTSDLV